MSKINIDEALRGVSEIVVGGITELHNEKIKEFLESEKEGLLRDIMYNQYQKYSTGRFLDSFIIDVAGIKDIADTPKYSVGLELQNIDEDKSFELLDEGGKLDHKVTKDAISDWIRNKNRLFDIGIPEDDAASIAITINKRGIRGEEGKMGKDVDASFQKFFDIDEREYNNKIQNKVIDYLNKLIGIIIWALQIKRLT